MNIDRYIRIGGWTVCRDVRMYVGMYVCRYECRHVRLEVCGLSRTCGRGYVGMIRGGSVCGDYHTIWVSITSTSYMEHGYLSAILYSLCLLYRPLL